jgi:class 3 adenylate cyclase
MRFHQSCFALCYSPAVGIDSAPTKGLAQQVDKRGTRVSQGASTPPNSAGLSGERRQVTVLFADMVGFTTIAERLGEEGTFALIQPIYALMAAAVTEQGGSVKDFTGDGVMAVFGAPDALEDAPLRACRAGLAIQQRLTAAASAIEAQHGVRPKMRIGINSGPAVVAQIGDAPGPATLGDTVNVASRLQTLAEPGTIYLSEATQRLVQGLVETTLAGLKPIKGKQELQNVYRLDGLRRGATRFDAAVTRGLNAYVGRRRELDFLQHALTEARGTLRVIDVVAEPGMGKSRLLYEFRRRIDDGRRFVLAGACSADGRQTPFLPFIEVVRGSFHVSAGEDENAIARKLVLGLDSLGLQSLENLGLLLNLLGLKAPDLALAGLDGVLIGLRTRDLLLSLLQARCRLSQVVMLIEDLHWADSVSQEVFEKIVEGAANLGLLILHTRRPEYEPPWRAAAPVTTLNLDPLPAEDIRELAQSRLRADALPETLARELIEKADGNALFAEEILSFLEERGVLRAIDGKVEFAEDQLAAALPASVQGLLTARVDRLPPMDRALLQAAAVIGRRFSVQLLAAIASDANDVEACLARMQKLDLVRPDGASGGYAFKHALVRDALYQSLLTGPRTALHLKIAEEIERANGDRLSEVVEMLAHHYSRTNRDSKAFGFLAMAGSKSLGVYSLDEADRAFASAIAILETRPECATDSQVADFLVDYTSFSNLMMRLNAVKSTVERFLSRLERLGDRPNVILVLHHYVLALLAMHQFRAAMETQDRLSAAADRIRDVRSRAYAIVSAIHVSTHTAPYPQDRFETICREAISAAADINEAPLRNSALSIVAWAEFHRGRMTKAHEIAEELRQLGTRMNDPRSLGLAMHNRSWAALFSDDYSTGLNFAEACLSIARSPYDEQSAETARIVALALLKHPGSLRLLSDRMALCAANNWQQHLAGLDGVFGVALVINGKIGDGIRWLEQAILRREREGYRVCADWFRLFLCEVYLEIISGSEKPPARVLVRNILTLARVAFTAEKRILALVDRVRRNPHFDPNGHFVGRTEMILGLLFRIKKRRALAVQHLREAERIASQIGPTPMLARIQAALAEAPAEAR